MKYLFLLVLTVIVAGGIYYSSQKIPSAISEQQAVDKVKSLSEVQDYLKRVPNGIVEVDNEVEGEYNVHVYEIKDGHTATFNWYRVNIKSGKLTPEVDIDNSP